MWLGLEALYQLTHSAHYELRVDMVDYELGRKYAHYQVSTTLFRFISLLVIFPEVWLGLQHQLSLPCLKL